MKRNPRHLWPLARLFSLNRLAPVVYVALQQLSAERRSPVITPTRNELCRLTGCRRAKTISGALTALHSAGWITRNLVKPSEGITWLRIVIRQSAVRGGVCGRGRKTPLTGHAAVRGEKRPISKGRKSPLDSLKREGANRHPLSAGVVSPLDNNNGNKNMAAPEPAESFVPLGPDGLPPAVSAAQKRLRGES
jgi:hypothetical protein